MKVYEDGKDAEIKVEIEVKAKLKTKVKAVWKELQKEETSPIQGE